MGRSRLWAPAAAAVLGLGAAACGGGATPTVAHLGATTSTTAAAGGGGSGNGISQAQAERFSTCMRAHGVSNFPDPTGGSNGGFGFQIRGGPGSGLDPSSSTFAAAQNACKSLLPNQGVGKPLTAAQQQAFLNWAACIRSHGMPDFPDPDFSGGGVRISVKAGNPGGQPGNGPPVQLQAAQKACSSKLPAGFAKLSG